MAETLNTLGELAGRRGDVPKAEEYYRQALAIREKLAPQSTGYAETLASLAGISRQKSQLDSAAQLYSRALEALESQTAHLGGTNDVRSGFRAKHATYYKNYIDLLREQNQPEIAFQVAEQWRARTLVEMLAQGHIDVRTGVEPGLLDQERLLRAEINAKSERRIRLLGDKHAEQQMKELNQEIGDRLAQYKNVEGQIRASSPGYAALITPQPLSAKEVQHLLDDDTLLLEYSLGERRSHVWVLTPNSLAGYELPKRADIESQARRVYDLLTARNRAVKDETSLQNELRLSKLHSEYRKAAVILSNMVLGPVAPELKSKRLVIVSDGALQYIPFGALPLPKVLGNSNPSMLLIASHEIVNLPSASVLALLRTEASGRKAATKTIAVVADPVFSSQDARVVNPNQDQRQTEAPHGSAEGSDQPSSSEHLARSLADVMPGRNAGVQLSRLPFSRQEAAAIMSLTSHGQAMEALDFDASRKTATDSKLAEFRIVHFATHGLLDSEHPELSGLVLSMVDRQGKPQNGFLELQDIYTLNLPVDLLVLSACETGLGKEIEGEGLLGLTRGFMYAGASRVVASLWKVDDVATAELMRRFYRAMLHDGQTPAEALRHAQVQMSQQRQWSDPYYWAAFTIQGDWKSAR